MSDEVAVALSGPRPGSTDPCQTLAGGVERRVSRVLVSDGFDHQDGCGRTAFIWVQTPVL